jgi:hypothetical protein
MYFYFGKLSEVALLFDAGQPVPVFCFFFLFFSPYTQILRDCTVAGNPDVPTHVLLFFFFGKMIAL